MNAESDSDKPHVFPSDSSSSTLSERWRLKGNDHFKSYQESINLMGKRRHLENAIQSYSEAYKTAENRDEKCSACKNYGTAAWRLVGILSMISRNWHKLEIESRLLEAIEFLAKGLSYGAQHKDVNWLDNLTALYIECVEYATTFQLKDLSYKEKIMKLEKYVNVMNDDTYRGKCFLEMASAMFIEAVVALASKDYKKALNALYDSHRPIHECLRLFRDDSRMLKEVNVIQEDVGFQLATAESLQAIDQGNILLKIAVDETDGIHMGLLYEVMDWYKKAIILTREVEVETEACALSHLGYVYDKVLKMKSRAKDYFMRCMQLATSLQPRNLQCESWFSTCAEALQRYQQESLVAEEERKQEERKGYLKELEKELLDLKQANEGSTVADFLKHIYATYPPKNSNFTLDLSQGPKKALLKSITHYHPDKQHTDTYGVKWAVLCEEITKLMTPRYEAYKFDPSQNTEVKDEDEDKDETTESDSAASETDENTETKSEDEDKDETTESDSAASEKDENTETKSEYEDKESTAESDSAASETDENTETKSEDEDDDETAESDSTASETDENTEMEFEQEDQEPTDQSESDESTTDDSVEMEFKGEEPHSTCQSDSATSIADENIKTEFKVEVYQPKYQSESTAFKTDENKRMKFGDEDERQTAQASQSESSSDSSCPEENG